MEKGQGKGTDTLQTDNVYTRKEYIEREAALSFPFANGQYDHENADPHFINGCESYREWLETIPAADVRPVVVCANCEHNNHCLTQEFVDDCGKIPLDRNTFFCADGERKRNA